MRAAKRECPFARVRERRGLSLEYAAARMRITPRHLRAVELGHRPLSWVLGIQMAKVYDCGMGDLWR